MTSQVSPSPGWRYPRPWICQVWRVPRSSVYAAAHPAPAPCPGTRGPKTPVDDATLLGAIRAILAACPFYGEGSRKVRARLAHRGLRVGGKRVLRLMRLHGLLAPRRLGHPHGDPAHAGTLVTDRPDVLWGTDAIRFYTAQDGWCWFFGAIDHGTDELVGWHATKIGDRWAALEPLRQGVRYAFGAFGKDVARGLTLRCDWGPQDHGRRVDRRSPVARHDDLPVVRRRARGQRGHRAGHADAEGAVPVPASVRQSGGSAARDRCLHPPVQHRVADRAARLSGASRRPGYGLGGGGATMLMVCPGKRERYTTRQVSTKDFERAG